MLTVSLVDNSDLVLNALPGEIKAALTAVGMEAETNVKNELDRAVYNTPPSPTYVRTGRLKNSITYAVEENAVLVGTNVEYAGFVENGTMKMPARPYLRPGIVNHIEQYKSTIKAALSK